MTASPVGSVDEAIDGALAFLAKLLAAILTSFDTIMICPVALFKRRTNVVHLAALLARRTSTIYARAVRRPLMNRNIPLRSLALALDALNALGPRPVARVGTVAAVIRFVGLMLGLFGVAVVAAGILGHSRAEGGCRQKKGEENFTHGIPRKKRVD
ncbi:MAG TPA: hypothetical protein VFP53_08925 [Sphingomicrobium sp.]|nr:hypothetical protein [Sphingomicrobium sp.]